MNIIDSQRVLAEVNQIMNRFESIDLHEMDNAKLLSRFDVKYVFSVLKLPEFLFKVKDHYKALCVANVPLTEYENLYFDTVDLKSYHDHHNQRGRRYKIRFRRYANTDECFFEVKRKNNKGRTDKDRMKVKDFERLLKQEHQEFLSKVLPAAGDLMPQISNRFSRITLVDVKERERLTLDFFISFRNGSSEKALPDLVIAEIKQEAPSRYSAFKNLMKDERIFPTGISKYCLGTILTHPGIKYNQFKPKLISLNKICDGII